MNSLYAVLKVQYIFNMAQWLSWLERRPVTAEVESSSLFWVVFKEKKIVYSGILAQLGEHLPYKQGVTGSSPVGPIYTSYSINDKNEYADVAQLAEQLICNQQVNGSSPFIGFNGQIPEWPKGTDCKSAGTAFEGSNPSLPITF